MNLKNDPRTIPLCGDRVYPNGFCMDNLTNSVMASTKKALNLDPLDSVFDPEIKMFINGALGVMNQAADARLTLVVDGTTTWSDIGLETDNIMNDALAKEYIYAKVRLSFDPPANSAVQQALDKTATEYLWRLNWQHELDVDKNDSTTR